MRRTSATMQKVGAMPLRREQSRRSPVKASLTIPKLSCRCFQHFPPTSSGGPFDRPCFVRTAEPARVLGLRRLASARQQCRSLGDLRHFRRRRKACERGSQDGVGGRSTGRAWRVQPEPRSSKDDGVKSGELLRIFRRLRDEQREALIQVVASGLSYEQAAEICDCQIDTIRSRVLEARRDDIGDLAGDLAEEEQFRASRGKAPRPFANAIGAAQELAPTKSPAPGRAGAGRSCAPRHGDKPLSGWLGLVRATDGWSTYGGARPNPSGH